MWTEDPAPAVVTAIAAAEPGADLPIVEPVAEETVDEARLERESPEFARLRKVHHLIETTYGTMKPIAAVAAVPADELAPLRTVAAAEPTGEADRGPAMAEPDHGFSTDEAIGPRVAGADSATPRQPQTEGPLIPSQPTDDAKFSTDEAIGPRVAGADSATPRQPQTEGPLTPSQPPDDAKFSTDEAIVLRAEPEDGLARFGPEADYLRKLRVVFKTTSGTLPDLAPSDDLRSRALEQWRLRNQELSRQFDAHFGINSERPDPVGPAPVADGAGDGATASVQGRPP